MKRIALTFIGVVTFPFLALLDALSGDEFNNSAKGE